MNKYKSGEGKLPVVPEDGSNEGEDDQKNKNEVSLRLKC